MRIKYLNDVINIFYFKKKRKLYFVMLMSLIASMFEYLGLVLIFQFIMLVSNPESRYTAVVLKFFKDFLNMDNFSNISLFLGISIALIYIFKNVYMYFFTAMNSSVLRDFSVEASVGIIKRILFCEYVKVNSIPNDIKQAVFAKIDMLVWGFLVYYINLITNIAIIALLIAFLLIKFTLIAVISIVFISTLSLIEYKILKSKSDYQKKYYTVSLDKMTKIIYKIINASKEIRLNNKGAYFLSEAEEKYKDFAILNKKMATNSVFHIYFTEISIMITFIIVLAVLFCTTNFDNSAVIVSMGAIIAVILRMTPAVNRAQSAIYGINSVENAVIDVINFTKQFNDKYDEYQTDEILPFNKEIELNNVEYSYPDSVYGLKNINLKIKKGEFVGIVGVSGCYKTTLSLIIAGLIKPQKGKVLVDNNELENENIARWHNNIAILSQEFSLIQDDIFEGLSDKIIEKLELKDFSSNPLELSFGQKQRAALAHIISQNRNVLILDEATSSLDVISEDKINEILFNLKGQKTIISIAHRLQILKYCDRIIFMDKGKIIDIDTFANLNNKYEEFKKIIELSEFKLRQ